MTENINKNIGEKIRMFRKKRGYTITQLGSMVYKSKSAISKYEKGEISIDITTLSDISRALDVAVSDLLPLEVDLSPCSQKDNGQAYTTLYLYTWNGLVRKHLRKHVIRTSGTRAEHFADVEDYHHPEECGYYYSGEVENAAGSIRIFARNPLQEMDVVIIQYLAPLGQNEEFDGFLSSYSVGQFPPFSLKCLLSYKPIKDEAYLKERLLLKKEELKEIKAWNAMVFSTSGL